MKTFVEYVDDTTGDHVGYMTVISGQPIWFNDDHSVEDDALPSGWIECSSSSTTGGGGGDADLTAVIALGTGQSSSSSVPTATFKVVFSEPINPSTFAFGDVTITGSSSGVVNSISQVGPLDGTQFEVTIGSLTTADVVSISLASGVVLTSSLKPNEASTGTPTVTYTASASSWAYPIAKGGTVNLGTGACAFPYGAISGTQTTVTGDVTITTDGTTYSNKNVTGSIYVNANNVIIENCTTQAIRISPTLVDEAGAVFITGSKITGPGGLEAGISYNNYTVEKSEITGTFDGLKFFGNCHITDCYIHDMACNATDGNTGGGYAHGDGVQCGGGEGFSITNCYFKNTGQNSGIFIFRDAAGGTSADPINGFDINGASIWHSGNFGLWVEVASDPAIPTAAWVPTLVSLQNIFMGAADPLQYNLSCVSSASATWRKGGRFEFPGSYTFTPAAWDEIYWANVAGDLFEITSYPSSATSTGGDRYGVNFNP